MTKACQNITKKIIPILKKQDVVKAAFFGSFARGEQIKTSDIDLLIKFKGKKNLLDLVSLKTNLEDITKTKVDLLTYDAINPLLRDYILGSECIIYEKRP